MDIVPPILVSEAPATMSISPLATLLSPAPLKILPDDCPLTPVMILIPPDMPAVPASAVFALTLPLFCSPKPLAMLIVPPVLSTFAPALIDSETPLAP